MGSCWLVGFYLCPTAPHQPLIHHCLAFCAFVVVASADPPTYYRSRRYISSIHFLLLLLLLLLLAYLPFLSSECRF